MAKKNIMQIIFIVVRLFIDEKNTISTETNNSMFSQSGGTFLNKPNGDMDQPGGGGGSSW